MNDKMFEILWREKEFRVFFLFWRSSTTQSTSQWRKKLFIKDKEILIKRKCHQARCDSRLVCHVEGIWAFDWNITEWSFSSLPIRFPFHQKAHSRLAVVMLYVFIRSLKTRQLVLTCASDDACSFSKLKQLLWYIVALIMKWDAALDAILILKYSFENNLIELNWSQRLNAAALDKKKKT